MPSAYSFGQKIGGSEVELDIDAIGAGGGKHAKIACAAERIPIDMSIHMGVHIDEAGGHEQPVGIDFTHTATGDATDLDVRPSAIAISAVNLAAPEPSTTVPPRITRSIAIRRTP